MLLKEMLKLEPGTLLQGFTVMPYVRGEEGSSIVQPAVLPRIVTLKPDGWSYPVEGYDLPVIRTLFYPAEHKPRKIKVRTSAEISRRGLENCKVADPWFNWGEHSPAEFHRGKPIGMHLGEFIIGRTGTKSKENKETNLYSKVLLMTGQVGFLVFGTPDSATSPLELI
jgi:hypothetical protein